MTFFLISLAAFSGSFAAQLLFLFVKKDIELFKKTHDPVFSPRSKANIISPSKKANVDAILNAIPNE